MKIFQLKNVIFTAVKNRCILPGRVSRSYTTPLIAKKLLSWSSNIYTLHKIIISLLGVGAGQT